MEIPKSIQPVWAEAIKDNKITKDELGKICDAASPNRQNKDFDDEEINFISTLGESIKKKGYVEGNIPDEFKPQDASQQAVSGTSANTSAANKEQSFDFIGKVGNASNSWAKKHPGKSFPRNQIFYVTKEGNLVSQSKLNETSKKDPNYIQTLGLKGASALFIPGLRSADADNFKLQNNKIVDKNQEVAKPQNKPSTPVTFVDENEEATPTTENQNPPNPENVPAKTPPTSTPENTPAKQSEIPVEPESNPEAAPNPSPKNQPTENAPSVVTPQTTPESNNGLPPIPEKLKAKWEELSKDGEINVSDLQQLLVAGQTGGLKRNEFNFLTALKTNIVDGKGTYKLPGKETQPTPQPASQSTKFNPGQVPDTLKETWQKVSADGKITRDDYKQLIKAAAPTNSGKELDDNEAKFLAGIKERIANNESIDIETGSSAAVQSSESKVDIAQAKTLINKYSSAFIPNPANATKRPQTEKLISDDIAKLSSSDLQSLKTQLAAIPDNNLDGGGHDGAKATLLAKVNIELGKRNSEKPTAQGLINKHSDAFQEVKKREGDSTAPTTQQQTTTEVNVPSTLKKVWGEVAKNGVVSVDDLNALIKEAKANGEELDVAEKKFLDDLTSKIIQGNGSLKL